MRLNDVFGDRLSPGAAGDARITGFAIDSRKVAPGTVFGAFRGTQMNGEDYIPQAIAAGAIAIVARPEAEVNGAVHIADAEPRRAFAHAAARFSRRFRIRWSRSPAPTARLRRWN
jgi:UDP-N-acetylmuramoyl-L-alanyl-D-glutamate--2,6-diaminopimelate ligase